MDEEEYLRRALRSPNQSGKSPLVAEYEAALARRFQSGHAIAVNSGSAAIQTALTVLGAAPGRTVLVSAAAPLPTLLPIAATGATLRFVDSRPNSVAIDPGAPSFEVDETVVAAVEVPLWGYPIDYAPLVDALAKKGVPLVEDAAQAHGATFSGRPVGTFGTLGCFSTHHKKLLSTGEGGFILTDDPELAERAARFARLGGLDGRSPGMNFKISAFTAAIGLARLQKLDDVIARRRANRQALAAAIAGSGLREMAHVGDPNGYNFVVDCADRPAAFFEALAEAGIGTDSRKYGYKPANEHPLFADSNASFPNATSMIARYVQLPTDSDPEATAARFLRVAAQWSPA